MKLPSNSLHAPLEYKNLSSLLVTRSSLREREMIKASWIGTLRR
jgi:hypothetical protein